MILRKDTTYRMNYLQPIRKVPKHALSGCLSLSDDFPDRLLRVTPQIGRNALQPGVVDSGHVTIVSRSVAALDQLQSNVA